MSNMKHYIKDIFIINFQIIQVYIFKHIYDQSLEQEDFYRKCNSFYRQNKFYIPGNMRNTYYHYFCYKILINTHSNYIFHWNSKIR
jgi:hypothetical protein